MTEHDLQMAKKIAASHNDQLTVQEILAARDKALLALAAENAESVNKIDSKKNVVAVSTSVQTSEQ